jgi:RNA-directed DNA polymerase
MRGIRAYLKEVLRLRINEHKSAVSQAWKRKFLGYSFTAERKSRLGVARESAKRFKQRVRKRLRGARGRSLKRTIETLNPLLRGWISYFQLAQTKWVLDDLDGWLRRKLLLWRQWKKPRTRVRKLRALGLDADRARMSASNGHGPWWNAGASHLNQALPAAYFARMGLVSLLREQRRLQSVG